MIRAADASGKMHEVLHQLSDLLERSVEVRRELVGATIYPMIVMVIMAISVVIFVTILLPKLMVPLQAQNVPLPLADPGPCWRSPTSSPPGGG